MPRITQKELDALNKKVEDAHHTAHTTRIGLDLHVVNLREQIRVRDEAIVQLSLRLSAYGDPGGPAIALAS